ncbi:hypothetical protein WLX15_24935, partial [Bordetella bronchiseptica]
MASPQRRRSHSSRGLALRPAGWSLTAEAPRAGAKEKNHKSATNRQTATERVDHRLRAGRAHDLGMLQGARQVQVI